MKTIILSFILIIIAYSSSAQADTSHRGRGRVPDTSIFMHRRAHGPANAAGQRATGTDTIRVIMMYADTTNKVSKNISWAYGYRIIGGGYGYLDSKKKKLSKNYVVLQSTQR